MSQNDFNIADANGATVLADLNAALQALASQSSGSSAPSTPYPAQPWFDTTTGLLKFRNAANNAWVTFGTIGDSSKFEAYVNNALAYDISTALVHTFAGTAAMKIPVGTSAQRPTAVQGMIRYNTTISNFELYDGSAWIVLGVPADGSITYLKMASAAIASLADIIAGTANKIINAANFKLGVRGVESMTWLGDFTASASSSINITSKITSEFDEYIIKLIDVVPATDNVTLLFRTSTNNGTSWDSGATDYTRSGNFNVSSNQTTAGGCATGESSLNMAGNVSNVSGRGLNATVTLASISSGNIMRMGEFTVRYSNNNGDLLTYQGSWRRNATTHINAIQFLMSSGNIASGVVRVYGLRKS